MMLGSKDYELHILQEQRFVFRRNANSRADVDPRATTLAIGDEDGANSIRIDRSTVATFVPTMPIGLDVQMHTSSPDVVRLPKRRSLFTYLTRSQRTLQSAIVVTAIRSGSAIGLLRCLLALAIATIIAPR